MNWILVLAFSTSPIALWHIDALNVICLKPLWHLRGVHVKSIRDEDCTALWGIRIKDAIQNCGKPYASFCQAPFNYRQPWHVVCIYIRKHIDISTVILFINLKVMVNGEVDKCGSGMWIIGYHSRHCQRRDHSLWIILIVCSMLVAWSQLSLVYLVEYFSFLTA